MLNKKVLGRSREKNLLIFRILITQSREKDMLNEKVLGRGHEKNHLIFRILITQSREKIS
jgi:hypothetical protein